MLTWFHFCAKLISEMSVNPLDDAKRWDLIHQKTQEESGAPSTYAQEKEQLFPRSCLVVELGGGTGADALYFLQKGHSVVVLDISEYALNVAEQKAKSANLGDKLAVRQIDFGLHKFPIKDASADVVYSRISLHYFDAEHTIDIFSDIYKMLKPGGSAYLTFKSPKDEKEMEYFKNTTTLFEPNVYIENGQLRSRFTVEQLKSMVEKAKIANASVNPYQEKLNLGGEGNQPVLLLNEVTFTRQA
jgi:ubiquinone/menaquinone biosynthesis C-methylase UbiE